MSILLCLFVLLPLSARRSLTLRQVTVTAQPLREAGVLKTTFDSLALRENVAQSMADVLTFSSSAFVKSYGRATLSTVAFRGTSPSHTRVTWNGMEFSSPMLGMTDFSTIPAFFVDRASMLHGASSVTESGGGLGGLVTLGTVAQVDSGAHGQVTLGAGSYRTFDEYARFTYGRDKWGSSTRVALSSSPNDFKYVNYDRKENIYDSDHQIIGQYHPTERNRSGSYRDLHLLQEFYYTPRRGDMLTLSAWYMDSNRELPMLTTDHGSDTDFDNRQRQRTLRTVAAWTHIRPRWRTELRGGYTHQWTAYDYRRQLSAELWSVMSRSRSTANTLFGAASAQFTPTRRWMLTVDVKMHQQMVRSADRAVITTVGSQAVVGYDKARVELTAAATARWRPTDRTGLSLVLRQDVAGTRVTPLIPALLADWLLSERGQVKLRASATRNHRFPSLNDLYFLPGGNAELKAETGVTYDAGLSAMTQLTGRVSLEGSAGWFDSRITDWIQWLPTTKGFFSPQNVGSVHSYGIELKASIGAELDRDWHLDVDGNFSWTPSVNVGTPRSEADKSVGRQLPYVPRCSASATGHLTWRLWQLSYRWCYYSRRYTMSSNELTLTGSLPPYFMSNVALQRDFAPGGIAMQAKLAVNNLFNEHYLTVLSRPMPGINFEFFLTLKI